MQCRYNMTKKKMMNRRALKERDGFDTRLLLFMKRIVGLRNPMIERLKKGVWLVSSKDQGWIIKEFSSPSKLKLQITLTNKLAERGFFNTYSFHPNLQETSFVLDDRVFGLIQYIEPHKKRPFHYETERNRRDALSLLAHFHETTEQFAFSLKNSLPMFNQLAKWRRRLDEFNQYMLQLRDRPFYPYLQQYSRIGEWTLEQLEGEHRNFLDQPHCIIHGDVAHHNFIRGKDEALYLIDFDLIGIAPSYLDLLQYCNRILPSLNWSAPALFSYKQIQPYEYEKFFLTALVFPTDIFREWNHHVQSGAVWKNKKKAFLEKITIGEYKARLEFNKSIIRRLEKL